jgi:hypothetical protein
LSGLVKIDKVKVPTSPKGCLISRQLLATLEHDPDEFAMATQPLFLVKAHKPWCGRVDSVVTTDLDLGV